MTSPILKPHTLTQVSFCFHALCALNTKGSCQAPFFTGQKEIVCPHPRPTPQPKKKPKPQS